MLQQYVDHLTLDAGDTRRAAGCDQAQRSAFPVIDVRRRVDICASGDQHFGNLAAVVWRQLPIAFDTIG